MFPPNIIPCFIDSPNAWINGTTVKAAFAADLNAAAFANAATSNPPEAALIFFRPSEIGISNSGINLGNDGLIFHELGSHRTNITAAAAGYQTGKVLANRLAVGLLVCAALWALSMFFQGLLIRRMASWRCFHAIALDALSRE